VILITTGSFCEVSQCTPFAGIHGVLEKPLEDDALLNGIHAALAYPIAPSVRTAATGSARW
jgi:hypothetical protein